MLRSCSYCGRIHDTKHDCGRKPKYKKRYTNIDGFRSTSAWQAKRGHIRDRDLNLCVVCKKNGYYEHSGLSCHHIESIEERYDLRLEDDNLITLCQRHHEDAEIGKISKEELKSLIAQR